MVKVFRRCNSLHLPARMKDVWHAGRKRNSRARLRITASYFKLRARNCCMTGKTNRGPSRHHAHKSHETKRRIRCCVANRNNSVAARMIRQTRPFPPPKADKTKPEPPSDVADMASQNAAVPVDNDASAATTANSNGNGNGNGNSNGSHILKRKVNESSRKYRYRQEWHHQCSELVAYLKRKKVWPRTRDAKSTKLNKWLNAQRACYRKKTGFLPMR